MVTMIAMVVVVMLQLVSVVLVVASPLLRENTDSDRLLLLEKTGSGRTCVGTMIIAMVVMVMVIVIMMMRVKEEGALLGRAAGELVGVRVVVGTAAKEGKEEDVKEPRVRVPDTGRTTATRAKMATIYVVKLGRESMAAVAAEARPVGGSRKKRRRSRATQPHHHQQGA